MNENTHRNFDVCFRILSSVGAIIVFCWGVKQFREQGERELRLEKAKIYWSFQNQLYVDMCNAAGALAATVSDSKMFEVEKTKFLSNYYGQISLVSDTSVEKRLVAIRDYLSDINLRNPDNQIAFKNKILQLSDACKRSSIVFQNQLKQ